MTSRSYTKSYSRKVNSVTPGSIQFDKLFRENSNRPSAAKSAGTVGKWGITSFTSIRSTNINGKRDNIHKTFGAKKMKIDYANQNAQVKSNKDPFSFETDVDSKNDAAAAAATAAAAAITVAAPPIIKPKKFFKSRNAPTIINNEIKQEATVINRSVPEIQYGRSGGVRSQKQNHHQSTPKQSQKTSHAPVRKISESMDGSSSDTSTRDDGKPPIVLRICKGTARLLSGDNQEINQESEPESYRITSPSPTKSDLSDRKSFSPDVTQKLNDQKTNVNINPRTGQQQSIITTVSIPLDNNDIPTRRTTRSRAKNLQLDLTQSTTNISPPQSSSQTTPNSQSSGLSLTLRKSVTDSNNTLISHYDIVKTDCTTSNYINSPSSNKPTIEPLIGRDQPLPTTTQELIDILSNDSELNNSRQAAAAAAAASKIISPSSPAVTKIINDNLSSNIQHCSIDLPLNDSADDAPVTDNEQIDEEKLLSDDCPSTKCNLDVTKIINDDPMANQISIADSERSAAKTLVDQDWFSGSEDSESASVNAEIETPINIPSSIPIDLQQSTVAMTANLNPSVKPITIKKGSIFKSRSTGATNGNKRRALYKHKWCDNDKEIIATDNIIANSLTPNTSLGSGINTGPVTFDEELDDTTELTRVVTYPDNAAEFGDDAEAITSVRCGKKVKGFYTVVKNVKKAHQIQESGEFQEFNDDVEYILDTLRENNPNATRCLSAIRLASKCMAPAFRMHVRAHGTVTKFFKALHDATKDQSLGLCTATVMFVLSQDRLAMDLDRNCLELMLSLLESDASHKDALDDCGLSRAELLKNKEKVRQLCADIQAQGHAKHLNLDNITVGQLAMETLLSLTSKRAGEWFKEELRELGGLEHIVNTIKDCHRYIISSDVTRCGWTESLLDKLRKVDRCLRVLENVTHMNEENQIYLLKYGDGLLVSTMASLYYLCGQEVPIYPTIDITDKTSTGAVLRECIFAILKVFINLTHRFNGQCKILLIIIVNIIIINV
ncbi:hypothetical protein PV325_006781 [Microctonus aethiopoides]|nr:hypothetical protein PV325_006781 [Microctonus aethiopoides]